MPRVDWEKKPLSRALWWFPLVGCAVGLFLLGWLKLAELLTLGPALTAAGGLVIPTLVTGGIHLDGFCDTADALASHQSRERKLEILKDSHTGAFAIISCVLLLLVHYSIWFSGDFSGEMALAAALVPVLARGLSALFAALLPNARGSGLLATFTEPMDRVWSRLIPGLWVLATGAGLVLLHPLAGLCALAAAGVTCVYYMVMSRAEFGGITGDLAGFFLVLCELMALLGLVIGQKWGVLV